MGVLADAFIRVRIDASGMKEDAEKEAKDAGEAAGSSFASSFSKGTALATVGVAGLGVAATGAFGAVAGGAALAGIAIANIGLKAILAGEQMTKTWEKFGQDVQKQMADIAKPLQPVLTTFMSTVKSTLTGLTPFFQQAFSALAPALQATIKTIGSTLVTLGPVFAQIAKSAAPFIQALGEGLAGALKEILPAVAGLFKQLQPLAPVFADLIKGFAGLFKPVLELVGALAQLGGPIVGVVVDLLGTVLSGLVDALVPVFKDLAVVMKPVIQTLGSALGTALKVVAQILGVVAPLFVDLFQAVQPLIPIILELVQNVLSNLLTVLTPIMPLISALVSALGQALVDALKQLLPAFVTLQDTVIQLLPALIPLVEAGLQLALALLPLVPAVAELAATLIQALLPAVVPIIEAVAGLATNLISLLVPAVQLIVQWLVGPLVDALKVAIEWLGDKLLEPIGNAAAWLIDHLLPAISGLWDGIVAGAKWFADGWTKIWQDVVSAAKTAWEAVAAAGQWFLDGWNKVLEDAKNAVQNAWNAIIAFGQWFIDGWKKVYEDASQAVTTMVDWVKARWQDLQSALSAAWQFVQQNVFQPIVNFVTVTIPNAFTAGVNLVKSSWEGWKTLIQAGWNFVRDNVFQPLNTFITQTVPNAFQQGVNLVKNAWEQWRQGLLNVWNLVKDNVFQPIVTFITQTVPNAFQQGVNKIGEWWDALKEKAAAPVRFVVNTVINRGVIDSINTVTGALGKNANIAHIPGFADGGQIPGPFGNVRRDNLVAFGPKGMASFQTGEYVMPVDMTRKYLPYLEMMRSGVWPKLSMSGHKGYADGGIIGAVTGAIGDIIDFMTDPLASIKNLVSRVIGGGFGQFEGSPFLEGLKNVPEKIWDAVKAWIDANLASLLGGGAPALGGPGGDSVAAILATARRFYPGAMVSSGYRPGSPDYHGAGLAADIIGGGAGGMATIARGFYALSNRLLEEIHSGGGGFFVKNGARVPASFYASEIAGHYDHVHIAANANALGFARGGTIPEPIVGYGRSGRRYTFGENGPETVIPNGAGVNLTVVVQGSVTDKEVAAIKSHVDEAFRTFKTQISTGRRK